MNPLPRVFGLIVSALVLSAPLAHAVDGNPPDRMTYQGYLVDSSGNALGNTNTGPKNYDVIFRIWADQNQSGTSYRLWTEQQTITVDKGYFSILLGEGSVVSGELRPTLSNVFTNQANASDRFIEVTVKGIGAGGSDSTMLPRMRLLPSPYAFLAKNAVNAYHADSATSSTSASSASTATLAALADHAAHLVNSDNDEITGMVSTNLVVNTNVAVIGTVAATRFTGYGTIPIGGIIMWSGTTAPTGWALCDGGTSNGQTTPDLRGRFVIASGNAVGLTSRTVDQTGGEEKHTLTTPEMPAHTHDFIAGGEDILLLGNTTGAKMDSGAAGGDFFAGPQYMVSGVQSAGSGTAHNNMPPYYVLAFIMRVK